MAKPYGLANQKLCYIQIYKILEKKTKNVLKNDRCKFLYSVSRYIFKQRNVADDEVVAIDYDDNGGYNDNVGHLKVIQMSLSLVVG